MQLSTTSQPRVAKFTGGYEFTVYVPSGVHQNASLDVPKRLAYIRLEARAMTTKNVHLSNAFCRSSNTVNRLFFIFLERFKQ